MPVYRIYHVRAGGRLQQGETLHCAGDEEAIERARDLSGELGGELWQGGRLLGRFSKLGVFTPAEA